MKITLELKDIDYASVVKFALPLLQGKHRCRRPLPQV